MPLDYIDVRFGSEADIDERPLMALAAGREFPRKQTVDLERCTRERVCPANWGEPANLMLCRSRRVLECDCTATVEVFPFELRIRVEH